MAERFGDVLLATGAVIAALCTAAVFYLIGWGEGPGAEFGVWIFGIIGAASLLISYAVKHVIGK